MKYEIGDKVIIDMSFIYKPHIQEILRLTNNILTISEVLEDEYCMEEVETAKWTESFIEGLSEDLIDNRFELLDL